MWPDDWRYRNSSTLEFYPIVYAYGVIEWQITMYYFLLIMKLSFML